MAESKLPLVCGLVGQVQNIWYREQGLGIYQCPDESETGFEHWWVVGPLHTAYHLLVFGRREDRGHVCTGGVSQL
jgi:hypothetical protein